MADLDPAGIEAAVKAYHPPGVTSETHRANMRRAVAAYLSVSPSRDGTVAVEDVARWMRLEVFGTGRYLAERFLAEFARSATGEQTDHGGDQ